MTRGVNGSSPPVQFHISITFPRKVRQTLPIPKFGKELILFYLFFPMRKKQRRHCYGEGPTNYLCRTSRRKHQSTWIQVLRGQSQKNPSRVLQGIRDRDVLEDDHDICEQAQSVSNVAIASPEGTYGDEHALKEVDDVRFESTGRTVTNEISSSCDGEQSNDDMHVPMGEGVEDVQDEVDPLPIIFCSGEMSPMPAEHVEDNNCAGMDVSAKETLSSLRKYMTPWTKILALILVGGSTRFTVQQYEEIRDLLHYFAPNYNLPSYSTVQRSIFPHAIQNCFVTSSIQWFSVDAAKLKTPLPRGRIQHTQNGDLHDNRKEAPIRIVLPSEWAKIDVICQPLFHQMFTTFACKESLEHSLVVTDRSSVVNPCESVIVTHKGRLLKVFRGGSIEVRTRAGNCIRADRLEWPSCIGEGTGNAFGYRVQRTADGRSVVIGTVAAIWCVGSPKNMTESAIQSRRTVLPREKLVIDMLCQGGPLVKNRLRTSSTTNLARRTSQSSRKRPRGRPTTLSAADDGQVILPGDLCCLLRPQETILSRSGQQFFMVVIFRHWVHADGVKLTRLAVFECPQRGRQDTGINELESTVYCENDLTRHVVCSRDVEGLISLHCPEGVQVEDATGRSSRVQNSSPLTGFLEDGTPYVVYRTLIYCDDFKPGTLLSPQGSAGGCYMLPMNLLPRDRTSRAAVRIIGLSPPGVSTNQILVHIIPDLLKSCVQGVNGRSPDGKRVRIFVDVVGYLGDYLESYGSVDLLGHRANAPCTACSFMKTRQEGSDYGFTSLVHGGNLSALRFAERTWALRESMIDDSDCNRLGMYANCRVCNENSPLLTFAQELSKIRSDIPLTRDGRPVVPGLFDPYRCNIIAPDHLLSGVARDLLTLSFACLPTAQDRRKMDAHVCNALAENGLPRQKSIYNDRKGLHSMRLSDIFCVLTMTASVYSTCVMETVEGSGIPQLVLHALQSLKDLVGLTYWWPRSGVDHVEDLQYFNGDSREAYFGDLQNSSARYLGMVDELCGKSPKAKELLDKPNVHRLLELYHHTIPSFGHARHIMELVLENAHQPLKRCMSQSNHRDPQVWAVAHCLANDWQGRVALLHDSAHDRSIDPNGDSSIGLRRLLAGEGASNFDETTEEGRRIVSEVDSTISGALFGPVLSRLRAGEKVCKLYSGREAWVSVGSIKDDEAKNVPIGTNGNIDILECLKAGEHILRKIIPEYGIGEEWKVNISRHAKLVKSSTSTSYKNEGRSPQNLCVYTGCVVRALIDRDCMDRADRLLLPIAGQDLEAYFFAVIGIIQRPHEDYPWAVVARCKKSEGDIVKVEFPESSGNLNPQLILVLELNESVRRVGIVHACALSKDGGCMIDSSGHGFKHGGTLFSGEPFFYVDRKRGFPPRIG